MKKPALPETGNAGSKIKQPMRGRLLDLLVNRVTLEEGVILLLLDTLGDGLLVTEGQVAGGGLALFFSFGAFKGDEFLGHDGIG
jgi:hypothetical protein